MMRMHALFLPLPSLDRKNSSSSDLTNKQDKNIRTEEEELVPLPAAFPDVSLPALVVCSATSA
jgi:hypothetical protein